MWGGGGADSTCPQIVFFITSIRDGKYDFKYESDKFVP